LITSESKANILKDITLSIFRYNIYW